MICILWVGRKAKEEQPNMKKTLSKLLALALTASLVLSGCGGNAEGGNSEANTQGGQANAEGSDKRNGKGHL